MLYLYSATALAFFLVFLCQISSSTYVDATLNNYFAPTLLLSKLSMQGDVYVFTFSSGALKRKLGPGKLARKNMSYL